MAVHIINPQDFISLDISYNKVKKIIDILLDKKYKLDKLQVMKIPNKDIQYKFLEYINDYTSKTDMNEICGVYQGNITKSFFKSGIYNEIDEIQSKTDYFKSYFDQNINRTWKNCR